MTKYSATVKINLTLEFPVKVNANGHKEAHNMIEAEYSIRNQDDLEEIGVMRIVKIIKNDIEVTDLQPIDET